MSIAIDSTGNALTAWAESRRSVNKGCLRLSDDRRRVEWITLRDLHWLEKVKYRLGFGNYSERRIFAFLALRIDTFVTTHLTVMHYLEYLSSIERKNRSFLCRLIPFFRIGSCDQLIEILNKISVILQNLIVNGGSISSRFFSIWREVALLLIDDLARLQTATRDPKLLLCINQFRREVVTFIDVPLEKEDAREKIATLPFFSNRFRDLVKTIRDPEGSKWVIRAAQVANDREKFLELLEEGRKRGWLDRKSLEGRTILILLAQHDEYNDLISTAIQQGCNPAVQEDESLRNTALTWALANACNGAAMAILSTAGRGSYLDIRSERGNSALHIAVAKGYRDRSKHNEVLKFSNHELVRKMLELGANANLQNSYGETPLHLACLRHDKEMIRDLLSAGANPNLRNKDGKTPFEMIDLGYQAATGILRGRVFVFLLDEKEYNAATDLVHNCMDRIGRLP